MHSVKVKRAINVLTASVLMSLFAYALSNTMIGTTMNSIIDDFSLTGASQGIMNTMIGFGGMVALLAAPLLQGRAPKVWLMIFSGALQCLMLFVTGLTGSMAVLVISCALLGAGGGLTDSITNSYLVDLHRENSARYLGLLHGLYGIGGLLTPLMVASVIALANWRASYFIAASVVGVLVVFSAALGLASYKKVHVVSAVRENKLSVPMLLGYLKNRRNILLLFAGVFYSASQMGLGNWLVRYMALRFGAAQLGSVALSIFWISITVSRFLAPLLPLKPMKIYIGGVVIGALVQVLGIVSGSAVGMMVATALAGLASGHAIPILLGEAARGNEDRTSLCTSAVLFTMCLSRMIMPLIMGSVTTRYSAEAAMLLPALVALLSAAAAYFADKMGLKSEIKASGSLG